MPPSAGSATDARLPTPVAIALGSNLGDRAAMLREAVIGLAALLEDLRTSTFHDTEAVDVPGSQPRYLNAAATGTTALAPRALLDALLAIERRLGRERPFTHAPRTLDLDLILYGKEILSEPGLTIPHPRFRERAFVLEPLAEIAPGMVDPVTGRTISELRMRLTSAQS